MQMSDSRPLIIEAVPCRGFVTLAAPKGATTENMRSAPVAPTCVGSDSITLGMG